MSHTLLQSATLDLNMVPTTRWGNLPVTRYEGDPRELLAKVPLFDRRPFHIGDGIAPNEFYDLIIRQPMLASPREVPVAVVSKRYGLVQHRALLQQALEATASRGVSIDSMDCSLELSIHGERMAFFLRLPKGFEFDPGDGHPMTLQFCCCNSVDGSSSLTANVGWYRFVCSNGLSVGLAASTLRGVHTRTLELENLGQVFAKGLEKAQTDRKLFERWRKIILSRERLITWIDGRLTKTWGAKAATRTLHIVSSGHDVDFADPFEKAPPSKRKVRQGKVVPGAIAGSNAYAACQALSWLASRRRDIQEQLQWTRDIPGLMRQLVE